MESTAGGPEAVETMPLTSVILFTSGVGYFQRQGTVDGEATLEFYFKTGDINDLLKSLVVQDLDGGQVAGVTYSSRAPLSRILQSFAVDLTGNPGLADILDQVRGEAVELAASERITGTVVGVETRPSGEFTSEAYLNLMTGQGLRSVKLDQVRELRFLNRELERDLYQALELLAEGHRTDKKQVSLSLLGQGRRRVRLGYLLEAPLWKTSYRLVLGEEEEHFLQGWAIVENTTDEDWRSVSLSLVSGRPISFTMDLYQPIYVPRPRVELELYSALGPQSYEEDLGVAAAPPAPSAKSRAAAPEELAGQAPGYGAGEGYREQEALDLRQGITATAEALEAGNLFRYAIRNPVTIPRQESAMLPIVNQGIQGRRVSIYNRSVQASHPLHGLKLKNTTGFDLMGGPLTVFEAGSYAGDARIDALPAGAERLISFAVDLDTEVAVSSRSVPDRLLSVRIVKGSLIRTLSLHREALYTIKNSDDRSRSLLIEHPLDPDWELVAPAAAEETTRSHYRFLVPVAAGGGEELAVVQERRLEQSVLLSDLDQEQITYYLSSRAVDQTVKQALEGLAARKAALEATVGQRQDEERSIDSIHREQNRIRSNMERLDRESALYKRYVSLLDEQEDELERSLERIEELRLQERRQREEMDRYILSLDIP
jgi:hypothetical protein